MPLFYFIWKHVVNDSANQEFSVFCDLDSEPGFIRTLVQSFSLENTDIFRGKRFRLNLPLNFDSRNSMSVESRSSGSGVDRTMYRMSSLQMQSFGWPLYTPASNLQLPPPPPHGLKKNRLRARQAEKSRLVWYIFVSVSSLWVHKHQGHQLWKLHSSNKAGKPKLLNQ